MVTSTTASLWLRFSVVSAGTKTAARRCESRAKNSQSPTESRSGNCSPSASALRRMIAVLGSRVGKKMLPVVEIASIDVDFVGHAVEQHRPPGEDEKRDRHTSLARRTASGNQLRRPSGSSLVVLRLPDKEVAVDEAGVGKALQGRNQRQRFCPRAARRRRRRATRRPRRAPAASRDCGQGLNPALSWRTTRISRRTGAAPPPSRASARSSTTTMSKVKPPCWSSTLCTACCT